MRKMPNWIQLLLQGTVAAEVKNKAETTLTGAMHRQEARKEAASPFSPPALQSPSSAPYWQGQQEPNWLPFFSMTTPSTRSVFGECKVGKAFPPLWDTDIAFLNCG